MRGHCRGAMAAGNQLGEKPKIVFATGNQNKLKEVGDTGKNDAHATEAVLSCDSDLN